MQIPCSTESRDNSAPDSRLSDAFPAARVRKIRRIKGSKTNHWTRTALPSRHCESSRSIASSGSVQSRAANGLRSVQRRLSGARFDSGAEKRRSAVSRASGAIPNGNSSTVPHTAPSATRCDLWRRRSRKPVGSQDRGTIISPPRSFRSLWAGGPVRRIRRQTQSNTQADPSVRDHRDA
jgi:hypothetical protein